MPHPSRVLRPSRCRSLTIGVAGAIALVGLFAAADLPGLPTLPDSAPRPVLAQGERFALSVAAQIGGGSAGFAASDDYLYVSVGPRIAVYDVRQPEAPTRVALTAPFPEAVKGLTRDGDRLYAIGWGGYLPETNYLAVLDIGDPARPRVLGRDPIAEVYSPTGVIAAHAGWVYLLDEGSAGSSMHVIDATDPQALRFGAAIPVERPQPEDRLRVAGDRLWSVAGAEGLVAYDLTDPGAPLELGRYDPLGAPLLDAVIAGDLAYATDGEGKLSVIDLADPAAMTSIHTVVVGDEAVSLATADGRLHVVHSFGVSAFDLANPRRPDYLGTLELLDVYGLGFYTFTHVGAAGDHAFVMSDNGTLRVIDYADPTDPTVVASPRVLPIVEDVAVDGDIAYVAAGWAGLWTLDVADPANPRVLGVTDVAIDELNPAMLTTLTAGGGFAYAFDAWGGTIHVVDARDPAAPAELGRVALPATGGISTIHSMVLSGGTLWVPYANQLHAVDVSQPAAPRRLGGVDVPWADSIAFAGTTAYVGGLGERSKGTVFVVDASDPTAPALIGRHTLGNSPYAPRLRTDGQMLYAGGEGLTVLDIRIPGSPQLVYRFARDEQPWYADIAISGGFAIALGMSMDLLDLRDPSQAGLAADLRIAGPDYVAGDRVTAQGDVAYVAAGEAGLYILRRTREGTQVDSPVQDTALEVTGQIGGGTSAVVSSGNHAYVAQGPRIAIYDVSPGAPATPLATTAAFDEVVRALAIDGDRLYAAIGGQDTDAYSLAALDVADPRAPRLLGRARVGDELSALAVLDEQVYVASYGGLRVVDVSDPAAMQVGEPFDELPDSSARLVVDGDRLYVIADALRIYDLADPAAPEIAGTWAPDDGGMLTDAAAAGDRAYALDDLGNLHVLDVAAPDAIEGLRAVAVGENPSRVAVADGNALVVVFADGLAIFTREDPDQPELLDMHALPGLWLEPQADLAVVDSPGIRALVSSTYFGVHVVNAVDIATWESDPLRGVPPAKGVAPAGDVAYIAGGIGGLWTVDIRDIANPRAMGRLGLRDSVEDLEPADLQCVTVAGDFAYAFSAAFGGFLHVVDVRDPSAPRPVGMVDLPSDQGVTPDVANIAFADGHVYVPFSERLWAVDVAQPSAPRVVGVIGIAGAHSVAVSGEVAYVGGADLPSRHATLTIVDVRDPSRPVLAGAPSILLGTNPPGLAIDGKLLYAAHGPFSIFDLAEPLLPRQVFQSGPDERGYIGIAGAGGFAFPVEAGVAAYDARDPAKARLRGAAKIPESMLASSYRIAAAGRLALVPRDEAGLYLLDRGEAGPDPGGQMPGKLYLPWVERGP